MYFLTPMCFICLQSNSDLKIFNSEMLTKLLNCLEKREDFLAPMCNKTKICNNCVNKLNTTFLSKKMCLNNIIQYKNYISQLEPTSNNFNSNLLEISLTDFKSPEKTNNINRVNGISKFNDLNFGQHIKEENFEEAYEIKLENQFETDSFDIKYQEILSEFVGQNLNENFGNVLVKRETDESYIESRGNSESQKGYYKEELKDKFKMLADHNYCKYQEPSENETNKKNNKSKLLYTSAIRKNKFALKEKLIKRIQFHNEEKPYYCDKCQNFLKNHTLAYKENKYSCSKCMSNFISLNRRLMFNINERSYSCSVCMKSFSRNGNLKQHMLIHTNKRLHSCPVCMKSFNRKGNLKLHILIHTDERPYSCPVCMKSFNHPSILKQHMLIHTNKRMHSCPECMKSFVQKGTLKQHMLSHTNERLHSCSVCMKSFNQKSTLKKHMLIHTSKRLHCPVCMKSFNQKSTLKKHMLIHTNERLHSCSVCMKNFTRKSSLKRHLMIHI